MTKLPVVNLFGQPNAGKSTIQGDVFSILKRAGVNCEMVREFAKELVWRNDLETLANQIYVFGEQQRRQNELSVRWRLQLATLHFSYQLFTILKNAPIWQS